MLDLRLLLVFFTNRVDFAVGQENQQQARIEIEPIYLLSANC